MLRALRWLRAWADKSHPNLIEIGICMVGVEWVSQFEVFAHFTMATDGGVSDVRSIAALLLSPHPFTCHCHSAGVRGAERELRLRYNLSVGLYSHAERGLNLPPAQSVLRLPNNARCLAGDDRGDQSENPRVRSPKHLPRHNRGASRLRLWPRVSGYEARQRWHLRCGPPNPDSCHESSAMNHQSFPAAVSK